MTEDVPEAPPNRPGPVALLGPVVAVGVCLRLALGAYCAIDPELARLPDDYVAFGRWWAEEGRYPVPTMGPILPALTRLLAGIPEDLARRVMVVLTTVGWGLGLVALLRLGRALRAPEPVRLAAVAALGLDSAYLVHSTMVGVEAYYAAALLAGLALWVEATEMAACRDAVPRLVASGGALGVAALTRGQGLLVIGVLTLVLVLRGRTRTLAPAFLAAAMALPLGWGAHNARETGTFRITTAADYNFAVLVVGPAYAAAHDTPYHQDLGLYRDVLPPETVYEARTLFREPALARRARDEALTWARSHAPEVTVAIVRGQARMLVSPGLAGLKRILPDGIAWALAAPTLVLRVGLLLLLGAGIVRVLRRGAAIRMRVLAAILCALVAAHVLPTGAAGNSRFLMPVLPLLYLAAGAVAATAKKRAGASPSDAVRAMLDPS